MQIKDIRAFRKWLKLQTGNEQKDENFIGFSYPYNTDSLEETKARGFFNVYHNQSEDIDAKLSTLLDMAQDSQAIYEFVQNAVDCNSTSFWMFYDDEHFIAINNGEPFDQRSVRTILNFAQSKKSQGENIGKFGVGFKLIHRMVGTGNGLQELTRDYVGPMIFSWSNQQQLQQLLGLTNLEDIEANDDSQWDRSQAAWFFKILLTCVPIMPTSLDPDLRDIHYQKRNDLFTSEEFFTFQHFLKEIWQTHANKFKTQDLSTGTIFYLRLGEEKAAKLDEDFEYFKKGIQYALSFIASLMKKKGLQQIYFKDHEPIEKDGSDIMLEPAYMIRTTEPEFAEIKARLKENEKTQHISFVFGFQAFENTAAYGQLRATPNFYKFFPMGKEVCGLNFIVHANIFEIEASRREFVQGDERNKFILRKLTERLKTSLTAYQQSDPKRFDDIFLAILFSNQPVHIGSGDWINKNLYEPLITYITENCPALDGSYKPANSLLMKDTDLDINPADFGIIGKYWFKWSKSDFNNITTLDGKKDQSYEKVVKPNRNWNIIDLITEGDKDAISDWLDKSGEKSQNLFFTELSKRWNNNADPKFWSKIIMLETLLDQVVLSPETQVKQNYLKNITTIILDSKREYKKSDYESKLLLLASDVLKLEDDREKFRAKIAVKDSDGLLHSLLTIREDDRVIFKEQGPNSTMIWELRLSAVLPKYKNKSGLLHEVIKNFERIEIKLQSFLNVRKAKSNDDIYRLLSTDHRQLTEAAQFVFLAFYSAEKKGDYIQSFDLSTLDITKVLDLYAENTNYPFHIQYARYLDGFTPTNSVYPDQWAITSEILPLKIKNWMGNDDSGIKLPFLKRIGVCFEGTELVKIRKALLEDTVVSQHQFDLVKEKSVALLLNTMTWLSRQDIQLKGSMQLAAVEKLLSSYYQSTEYNPMHPQLYFDEMPTDKQPAYKFKAADPQAIQISSAIVEDLYQSGITISTLFAAIDATGRSLLDNRMYPEVRHKKILLPHPEILDRPDFYYLYQNSYSFDLPFFASWQAANQLKFLFIDGEILRRISFEGQALKVYQDGNFERDPSSGIIYINVNPKLDNSAKAELIVDIIKHQLSPDYLSGQAKEYLGIAYWQWLQGENPDISTLRRKQVAESTAYTFEWLKATFDWEYDASAEKSRSLKLSFERASLVNGHLVLGSCNYETIPARVEFYADPVIICLKKKSKVRNVVCRLVNYTEFELTFSFESKDDSDYFLQFQSLTEFAGTFNLDAEDVLMNSLRDGLFGVAGLAPKTGDVREYLKERLSEKKLSFLFGPPGTGKTTKLAVDILLTLCYNRQVQQPTRILVLTPTNKAADVVLERIIQLLSDTEKLALAAGTYYSRENVLRLVDFCKTIIQSGEYKQLLIRFGGSISEDLINHQIVQNRLSDTSPQKDFVLATTVHRLSFDSYQGTPLRSVEQRWTHVVVDESSMVPLPHIVFLLLHLAHLPEVTNRAGLLSTFLFSGDPFQIQPVGRTPNYIEQGKDHLKGWSTENVYTLWGLDSFAMNRTPVGNFYIKKLMKQYRSVPALGELFSKYKYDHKIAHHQESNKVDIALNSFELANINFVEFNVFDEGSTAQEEVYVIQKYGAYSAYHIYSIVLACELASALKLQHPDKSVCIITPYGTQARLAKEISYAFKARNPLNSFTVSTVHRYQGDESDIVILLMNPPKVKTYEFSHFNNSFLINVGISRAKESLIIMHPKQLSGYSEIREVIWPLAANPRTVSGFELEKTLFPKHQTNNSAIENMIEIANFQSFNVADLMPFKAARKQYFFFIDNRESEKDEKKYVNVIVDILNRKPLLEHVEPKVNMTVKGTIDAIHTNNKTAFVKLDQIKGNAVIHNNAISQSYISNISNVLNVDQKITAKITAINERGIQLSMIGIKQSVS